MTTLRDEFCDAHQDESLVFSGPRSDKHGQNYGRSSCKTRMELDDEFTRLYGVSALSKMVPRPSACVLPSGMAAIGAAYVITISRRKDRRR